MADIEYGKMETLPYAQVVEPFGKINVWRQPDGSRQVRAYILMENIKEGAQTGVAIQGSRSMKGTFGFTGWKGILLNRRTGLNVVSLTAQKMCSYLARKVDADGSTTVIYWATGAGSAQVEEIGGLTAYQVECYDFVGPKKFGSSAKLLPAVRYFVERFAEAQWGMYVFITDGKIQDLDAVKQYTTQLARDISARRRNDLKLVMIGVGQQIDESQMQQLDDLNTGMDVDLWDHRLAAEMRNLIEIFAEVVDEHTIVADKGVIKDSKGNVLKDYRKTGLPALLLFTLPAGSRSFTLEIGERSITQPLL